MDIEIDLTKSIDENAAVYFELAKKAKKKLEGAKDALLDSKKKLEKLRKEEATFFQVEEKKKEKKEYKREWYEKFHWFFSSEDFLCIGGKDSTSNEVLIKKHLEKDDLVFHTDMSGSPFFIIKNGQKASEKTKEEAAQGVAIYSRAWKLGHTTAEVFCVNPTQVSKEAKAGEFVSKGSFMIYGKKEYYHPTLSCTIGVKDERIIGGPTLAINTPKMVTVVPGDEKKSTLAKKVKAKLGQVDLDEIMFFLPSGEGQIERK